MAVVEAAPTVSVVIPTYNRARVLPRALQSALCQSFEDFEVVVVDDGSTDDTRQVLAAITDPRIRLAGFERNRGIGAARHEGVARSRGRLIAFLDSDDCWKPGKLAKVVAAFDRHPELDLVFSDYEDVNHIRSTTERGFEEAAELLHRLVARPLQDGWWRIESGAAKAFLWGNFVGTTSVVAARRALFDRVGNFRDDLSGPEDFEFLWRATVLGARFAYTDEALVERHKDESSITTRKRAFVPQRLRALDACEAAARIAGRLDLLPGLRDARARTCCDLIEACALEGRRLDAWRSFWASRRFGWSVDAVRYLVAATAGPRLISMLRRTQRQ